MLVGAGIMSATLGALLRRLEPDWSITLIERLDAVAAESSSPWNNAGTGHSALCELNYTPQNPDGSIDITKAVRINEQFQVTRQFWAYAVENGILTDRSFLNPIPHVSFVRGAQRVDYLRRRQRALAGNPLFARTELIDDPDEFARRLPFMAAKRDFSEPTALNWASDGTDVDFGSLSRQLVGFCVRNGTTALFGHEVRNLTRQSDGSWTLLIRNRRTRRKAPAERQIRLRRRRWGCAAAVAEVGHRRGQGLRRLSDRRPVPARRQPGAHRRAPRQGVRRSGARGPAARRAASRPSVRQRQVVAGVRAVRRAGRQSS